MHEQALEPRLRALLACAALTLLAACAAQPDRSPIDRDSRTGIDRTGIDRTVRGEPFAGLWLGDAKEGGAIVLGMVAGPAAIAGIEQGDRILRIGGLAVDAHKAYTSIASSSPGQRLRLDVMRGDVLLPIELTIEARAHWSAPAAFAAAVPFADVRLDNMAEMPDPAIAQAAAGFPELESINLRLDRMFADLAREQNGFHKLPLLRIALMRPGAIAGWRDELLERLQAAPQRSAHLVDAICETLALSCPDAATESRDPPAALAQFSGEIANANQQVREVFDRVEGGRVQAVADMHFLLETTSTDRTLLRQPGVVRGIRAMQLSMNVNLAGLLAAAARLHANAQTMPVFSGPGRAPPAALRSLVEGEILDYAEVDGGYVVVGGFGANRYDMDRLYAVIDPGGDDVYRWSDATPLETQTVIDMAGNDRYLAARAGPGAGWLGVSLLIDRAGNDFYESALGGCGAGALGIGFLFDGQGADTYRCAAWSIGAALYGAGVLIDDGDETDVYLSQTFSQGVGGPRGFGLLLDAGGADSYRANGPVPSAYGTPGSYMGFSQGVGVGIRPYDTGGVGLLFDLGGDDRYEGGEFSQGGGYFWGLGILHDRAGDDLYYGNRYAQGFAAHQAFGMLSDLSGDDVYWAMTAAAQGAAWDQSIAMLYDAAGNDVYRAQSLSQGAAAQQARASLHDLSGDDVYGATHPVAQGAAGENTYHFSAGDPIYSLGVLLDDSGVDRYSSGLADGESRLMPMDLDREESGGVAGVAIDQY